VYLAPADLALFFRKNAFQCSRPPPGLQK
jgi:hypothetical protein